MVSPGLKPLPMGVAVDGAGNVYIADTFNNAIKKWTAANSNVTTLVASGLALSHWRGGGQLGQFVYRRKRQQYGLDEWTAANSNVTTLVSSGFEQSHWGVAVDSAGNVYFADTGNNAIKKWTAANNTVTTLVSSGLSFSNPAAVAVDGAGNVYIADSGNNAIKELPYAFVDPTPKLESASGRLENAAGGSDVLPVVLPATENLTGPLTPTSDQSWLTITGSHE